MSKGYPMDTLVVILNILILLLAILLSFIVLIQPARGEGIASAFAGVGSESFFGTKAHSQISRVTIVLAVLLLLAVIGVNLYNVGKQEGREDKPAPAKTEDGSSN